MSTDTRPWVERYRPQNLDQVSHQPEVVATLRNAVATGRLPHLLLYGPPGSGKTSVALALCRQLWPPSEWKRRVLELNASDERGISVVRDKVQHFARLAVGNSSSNTASAASKKAAASFFVKPKVDEEKDKDDMDVDVQEKKYPNPPFKIIILDEADTMTPDAQSALRRIIEAHSRLTRFILICNYVTRIIEPLASRCAKFRFQALPSESMKERLQAIAHAEGCNDSEISLLDDILQSSQGDMRRAVTTLQSVHSLAVGGAKITNDVIAELAGTPPAYVIETLWTVLQTGSFDKMQNAVQSIMAEGFAGALVLSALLEPILNDNSKKLTELHKSQLCIRMAEAEKNMVEGADEYLQLMTVTSLTTACFAQCNGLEHMQ